MFSGKYTEDVGYPIYHLYSLNINTREALLIEENISVGFNLQSVGLICAGNLLYDTFIKNNDELYYEKKDDSERNPRWELYKTNISNNTTQKIFSKNKDTDMLMSINVTDNYVFFIYSVADEYGNGKVYVFRMKHDGSELVKLNEIPTIYISNLPTATLYIVNDKVIIYNNSENFEGDKIIILDFDGNRLDWDI